MTRLGKLDFIFDVAQLLSERLEIEEYTKFIVEAYIEAIRSR